MRKLGLVWLGAIALGPGLLAASASAVVVHRPDGRSLGVMPRAGINPAAMPGLAPAARARRSPDSKPSDGNLDYHGGVVLHATRPYLIFWDPAGAITAGTENVFETYLTDTSSTGLVNSDVYAVGRQYTDATGFADDGQTFDATDQALIDTHPFPDNSSSACPTSAGESACVTDLQLEQELETLIATKGLPGGNGANAPVYFMITPSDVNVCLDGATCADNFFCAYHSNFTDGSSAGSQDVIYASIPLLGANKVCQDDNTGAVQAPNGVQPDGVAPDVAVDNMSHEYNEAITDPDGDGWWSNNSGNEEADNCEAWGPTDDPQNATNPNAYKPTLGTAPNGSLFDQSIDGGSFYTQSEWSNASSDCFLELTGLPPVPTFTTAEPGGNIVTFDPSASTSASPGGFSSTTWDFGDGTSSFAPGGPVPISHTFSGPGPEQATLTLVDSTGSLATATHTIDVIAPPAQAGSVPPVASKPTAIFSSSPKHPASGLPVHFDASHSTDTGAAITAYAWNFGDGGTSSGLRPSHTYRHPGRYALTLTVTDGSGHRATSTEGLHVVAPGKISRLNLRRSGNGLKLRVKLTGPGTVRVGSHRHLVTRARTLTIGVGLSRAQRRALHQRLHFVYTVRVLFVPQAGRNVRNAARIRL